MVQDDLVFPIVHKSARTYQSNDREVENVIEDMDQLLCTNRPRADSHASEAEQSSTEGAPPQGGHSQRKEGCPAGPQLPSPEVSFPASLHDVGNYSPGPYAHLSRTTPHLSDERDYSPASAPIATTVESGMSQNLAQCDPSTLAVLRRSERLQARSASQHGQETGVGREVEDAGEDVLSPPPVEALKTSTGTDPAAQASAAGCPPFERDHCRPSTSLS
jgi:hypothetical protein